ncbi:hypothetical protein B0T16DRAFT_422595 [Cercophora newfieldiana]|uniref:Uncharacterized protein n=1 Tax=Cercophora newfieldiana TaxID=92897 RepID=A0AA39XSW8_9PEZI|nr:hypothetical protein B0T16DRAFT_422595 [Cercophora newfieldiana]
MADTLLDRQLRTATTTQVSEILAKARETTDAAPLTSHLLAATQTGALPPAVFQQYISQHEHRDPHALAAALKQTHSASIRRVAISQLEVALRPGPQFRATWAALGGAAGIAALLRELSVHDVEALCSAIGTAGGRRDPEATAEKEAAVTELYILVYKSSPDEELPEDRDERPLRASYRRLFGACTAEFRSQWHRKEITDTAAPTPSYTQGSGSIAYPDYLLPGQEEKLRGPRKRSDKLNGVEWLLSQEKLRNVQREAAEKIDLCHGKDLKIDAPEFYRGILLRLTTLMGRRRPPNGTRDKTWEMVLGCFKRWPELCHELNFEKDGLLSHAIRWWNYVPTEERHVQAGVVLRALLDLVPRSMFPTLVEYPEILRVKLAHRWELFVWLFRNPKKYGINAESPTDEDKEKLKGLKNTTSFPSQLFILLPADKAVDLLNLISDARPDHTFLSRRWGAPGYRQTILSELAEPGKNDHADFPIVHSLALTRLGPKDPRRLDSEVLNNIEDLLKTRMSKASQSRDWSDRLFWTKSALFLTIAAGSLELYSKTLRWARRFDKDPQTVCRLYQAEVINTKEGLNLLAAIPSTNRLSTVPINTVKADIVAANEVVIQLLETAAAALQEPGFSNSSWYTIGRLASTVVNQRIQLVNAFQSHHKLSDEEVYNLVWEPTISMLTTAERIVIAEENAGLYMSKRHGLLEGFDVVEPRDHTWRFIDELARARDELWRQERVKRCPAVLSLDTPWPKGLPVHDLCQFRFGEATVKLPYVVSRAEAVVFADAKFLRRPAPTDDEMRNAISSFIDDYKSCVEIYISAGDGEDHRKDRGARAWRHATTELTSEVITNEKQADAFWKRWAFTSLRKWMPEPSVSSMNLRPGPVFPRQEDPNEPLEWHPDPEAKATPSSERELPGPVSVLEALLQGQYPSRLPWDVQPLPTRRTVTIQAVPGFWCPSRYDSPLSGETQDVYIAAAMLYINSRIGSDTSLFRKAYPSAENPRFPAVYLADEFLEESKPDSLFSCLSILQSYQERVPPELLLQLARSLLERLRTIEKNRANHLKLAMDIILLLSRGERPLIACDVIQDILIDGQGDSAWHRHLFNSGFLALLPAEEVKRFLNGMTDAMTNRLAQAKKNRTPTPAPLLEDQPAAKSSQPFIKITTVKMLAQTLRGSTVVDEHTICGILAKILSNSDHMDIKIAGIESLVDVFTNTKNVKLKHTIMDVLRKRVAPIAASLVERRPMTEEDWAKAEAEGTVPEIADVSPTERPLLNLLFHIGLDSNLKLTPEWNRQWVETVLFDILEQSTQNNKRWIALFEKANSLSRPAGESLPAVPVVARMYNDLLRDRPEFVSASIFERIRQHVMANISPPPGIAAINAKIKGDAVLDASKGVGHWRTLFANGNIGTLYLGIDTCAALLNRPASVWANFPADGITVPLLQDFLFSVARIFIDASDLRSLNHLEVALSTVPSWGFNRKHCRESQIANAIPVLERIVSHVKSLRTPEWQRDRHRCPRHLPDTFESRLRMLPYPSTSFNPNSEPAPDDEITAFGNKVIALIDELVSRGTPYHDDWNTLKAAIARTPVSKSDFLRIALVLGKGVADPEEPREPTLAEYMRAELARELIRKGEDPKDRAVLRRTRDLLVLQWKHNPNEVIRERARATIKGLKESAKTRRDGNQFWAKYAEEWNSAVAAACAAFGAKGARAKQVGWMGEDSSDDES